MKEDTQTNQQAKDTSSKYDLTNEEYNICLKMAELALFMHAEVSPNPTSVFVVAQPGAGKTGLRTYIENQYQCKDKKHTFIEFNPDEVAMYHKHYNKILEENPKESYHILDKFVRPALDTYLRKKAVFLRTNIMQEGTFASTEGYLDILKFQKMGGIANIGHLREDGSMESVYVPGGYYIDINILAVDRFESLLSSYEREQEFIEKGIPARAVTADNHDRAYKRILDTIRLTEQLRLYNRMRVFKRGKIEQQPQMVFEAGDKKYHNVVEAIIYEREKNKKELFSNPEQYLTRIQSLHERIIQNENQRNAQIQLNKLGELKEEFLVEIEKSKQK